MTSGTSLPISNFVAVIVNSYYYAKNTSVVVQQLQSRRFFWGDGGSVHVFHCCPPTLISCSQKQLW